MPLRTIVLLCLASLLVACSSEPPKSAQPQSLPQPKTDAPADLGPLPVYQRELSGVLTGVPAGAEVELAMLIVDERGRPQGLMASSKIAGNNQPLPFKLRFNPQAFPAGARVELRGRASQSGQLILHLPSRIINQPTTQTLGTLALVKAP
ncbi:YbaY family lipoprotein [Pseudomonas taetrolens]|uniref:YbaY family lipoprotein n=1 Tax=Pseudomonas taetrolens TaxID=47884 RepID=UPI003F961654